MSIANYIFKMALSNKELAKKELENLTPENISFEALYDFYLTLKNQVLSFSVPDKAVFDLAGTGGSGKARVNLSTILAIKLSKTLTIAKHANRGASTKVGSIDIVEKMSYPVSLNAGDALSSIKRHNLCFLFAPAFHPALSIVSTLRKEIGRPTIFNFVMPLINPIRNLKAQLIGCSNLRMMQLMARVAVLENKNILFVHDLDNQLDDVSITGKTAIIDVKNGQSKSYTIEPKDLGTRAVPSFSLISGYDNVKRNLRLWQMLFWRVAPLAPIYNS